MRAFARHEAARLCHQDYQCGLTHVCGFSGHVRTCYQQQALLFLVEIRVIADEYPVSYSLLDYRMPALPYLDDLSVVDCRLYISVLFTHICERDQHVERCDRSGRFLYLSYMLLQRLPDIREKIVLHLVDLRLCVQHQAFRLLEFGSDETLAVCKRLFSDIVVRDHVVVRSCHLEIVPEHLVEPDLEVFYTCSLAFTGFEAGDPVLSILYRAFEFVQLLRIPCFYQAAFFYGKRRIFDYPGVYRVVDLFQRMYPAFQFGKQRGVCRHQLVLYVRKHMA